MGKVVQGRTKVLSRTLYGLSETQLLAALSLRHRTILALFVSEGDGFRDFKVYSWPRATTCTPSTTTAHRQRAVCCLLGYSRYIFFIEPISEAPLYLSALLYCARSR
jgi:hypothetical protein